MTFPKASDISSDQLAEWLREPHRKGAAAFTPAHLMRMGAGRIEHLEAAVSESAASQAAKTTDPEPTSDTHSRIASLKQRIATSSTVSERLMLLDLLELLIARQQEEWGTARIGDSGELWDEFECADATAAARIVGEYNKAEDLDGTVVVVKRRAASSASPWEIAFR